MYDLRFKYTQLQKLKKQKKVILGAAAEHFDIAPAFSVSSTVLSSGALIAALAAVCWRGP